MGRKIKESTRQITKLLETTDLTLQEIGDKFGKTKQAVSYIKKAHKVVRPKKENLGVEIAKISNLIKEEIGEKRNDSKTFKKVLVVCPICHERKEVDIPESVVKESRSLATIYIDKGLACEHGFQAFVDKNFQVRGYKNDDYRVSKEENDKKSRDENLLGMLKVMEEEKKKKREVMTDDEILGDIDLHEGIDDEEIKKKRMTDKEIYEEFREFIDDDNEEFREFIKKDKRREEKKKKDKRREEKKRKDSKKKGKKRIDEEKREQILQSYYLNELEKEIERLLVKEGG